MKSYKDNMVKKLMEVVPTIEEIAKMIWSMDSIEQAELLNHIAEQPKNHGDLEMQIFYILDEKLSDKAIDLAVTFINCLKCVEEK